eukprot:PITA_25179
MSDKDAKFTSKFSKELFAGLGTKFFFRITYHPKTYGQTERVNRILEDMLRMYVMHQQRKLEEYLPLVEFAYNKNYQESLRMSPFEALSGKSCNTLISWSDPISKVELDGQFQLEPQSILQKKVLMLWNQAIEQVKVQWKHFGPNEATWDMADQMRAMYPSLFTG